MRIDKRRFQRSSFIEVAVLLGVIGLPIGLVSDRVQLFVWTSALLWALFAMGTNVLLGWAHILSFGQAAYFGAGAYAVALLRDTGLAPPLVVIVGALAALALALPFATVAVRTRGVEFAVLTLVFSMALWLLTYRIPLFGGDNGISRIPRGTLLGMSLESDGAFWWYVLVMCGIAFVLLRRLHRSSFGAALTAVRDDPVGAAARGIPVRRLQVAAFTIAGVFSGVSGGMFAQAQGVVSPSMLFWVVSGNALLMCILGGLHRFWGPALGGIVFTWLFHLVIERTTSPVLYAGVILVAAVVLLPEGLIGAAERLMGRLRQGDGPAPPDADGGAEAAVESRGPIAAPERTS